jgi:hypothetical protein
LRLCLRLRTGLRLRPGARALTVHLLRPASAVVIVVIVLLGKCRNGTAQHQNPRESQVRSHTDQPKARPRCR